VLVRVGNSVVATKRSGQIGSDIEMMLLNSPGGSTLPSLMGQAVHDLHVDVTVGLTLVFVVIME